MPLMDKFGLGPQRTVVKQDDGTYSISVVPNPISGMPQIPQYVILRTQEEFQGYLDWLQGGKLIQDVLPSLSIAEREILLSGIGPEQWNKIFPPKEEE